MVPASRTGLVQATVERAIAMRGAPLTTTRLQESLGVRSNGAQRALCDIVERMAIVHQAGDSDDQEHAIEALGCLAASCAELAELHRLDVDPIIELANIYRRYEPEMHSLVAVGLLCGYRDVNELVDGLGLVLVKALDEVEIVHNLTVDLQMVYAIVAREIVDARIEVKSLRERLYTSRPQATPAPVDKRPALELLRGGIDDLKRAEDIEGSGSFVVGGDLVYCRECAAPMSQNPATEMWTCNQGHVISDRQRLEITSDRR